MSRPMKPHVTIPSYDHLRSVLLDIDDNKWRPFFSVIYLTGARISERPYRWGRQEVNGEMFAIAYINTRKNPIQKMRNVPINIEKERDLIDMVNDYRNLTKYNPEYYEVSRQYIDRMYKKLIEPSLPKTYPHFLRTFRANHVASENERLGLPPYREDQLCQYFGWSDFDSAKPYLHLRFLRLV